MENLSPRRKYKNLPDPVKMVMIFEKEHGVNQTSQQVNYKNWIIIDLVRTSCEPIFDLAKISQDMFDPVRIGRSTRSLTQSVRKI